MAYISKYKGSEIDALLTDAKNTKTSFNSFKTSTDSTIESIQSNITEVNNKITSTVTNISNLGTRIEEVEQNAGNVSKDELDKKQDKLVSGNNIKTINGQSVLGEGNIAIEGGGVNYDDTEIKQQISNLSNNKVDKSSVATINGQSIINGGNITIEGGTVSTTEKKSIAILFVGNSLTQDGIAYLPYVLKTYYPEIDFKIYMWYMGGKTLADHYSAFTSGGKANIFSVAENTTAWANSSTTVMSSVLSTYKFDIVCMQEYFNYKESYKDCTDWNNCRDYITTNYKGGNPLKFISLFHAPLRKDGYDVNDVFKRTEDGNALILQSTISEDLIPNGIAVYRALDTELNTLGDLGQLSPDGTHTQEGLPCLLQTWVTLLWLFDKLGINKSIYGHPMRMTTAIYNSISVPGANLGSGVIQGTDAQNILAQEVAINAYKEGKQFLMKNLYPTEWGGGGLLYATFTINCSVADATIKINGLEQTSVTAIIGSTITWEVTKEEYRPQSGTFVLSGDKDLNIVLLPVVDIDSISAEFSQGQRTIFNEDEVEDLRKYLVVSVNYADGSTETTEDYTLSGTLSGGTSTMTASFGGKDTTFDVEVTEVSIPEGYTRYGWLSCKNTSKTSKAPSNYIYLAADEDWNRLSMECYIGKRPNVTHSSGSGLFGARLASSENSNPWYGLYVPVDNIRVDARNSNIAVPYPSDMSKIKVVLDNRQTSPMYASANDGAVVEKAWTTSDVINVPMSLFNNIPDGSTTNMNFNYFFRIGEMKFRDYEGRCVYYYIPVVNSSKQIGMFDVINQRFCTAATAAAVTIGNSSCVHEVGNW